VMGIFVAMRILLMAIATNLKATRRVLNEEEPQKDRSHLHWSPPVDHSGLGASLVDNSLDASAVGKAATLVNTQVVQQIISPQGRKGKAGKTNGRTVLGRPRPPSAALGRPRPPSAVLGVDQEVLALSSLVSTNIMPAFLKLFQNLILEGEKAGNQQHGRTGKAGKNGRTGKEGKHGRTGTEGKNKGRTGKAGRTNGRKGRAGNQDVALEGCVEFGLLVHRCQEIVDIILLMKATKNSGTQGRSGPALVAAAALSKPRVDAAEAALSEATPDEYAVIKPVLAWCDDWFGHGPCLEALSLPALAGNLLS